MLSHPVKALLKTFALLFKIFLTQEETTQSFCCKIDFSTWNSKSYLKWTKGEITKLEIVIFLSNNIHAFGSQNIFLFSGKNNCPL